MLDEGAFLRDDTSIKHLLGYASTIEGEDLASRRRCLEKDGGLGFIGVLGRKHEDVDIGVKSRLFSPVDRTAILEPWREARQRGVYRPAIGITTDRPRENAANVQARPDQIPQQIEKQIQSLRARQMAEMADDEPRPTLARNGRWSGSRNEGGIADDPTESNRPIPCFETRAHGRGQKYMRRLSAQGKQQPHQPSLPIDIAEAVVMQIACVAGRPRHEDHQDGIDQSQISLAGDIANASAGRRMPEKTHAGVASSQETRQVPRDPAQSSARGRVVRLDIMSVTQHLNHSGGNEGQPHQRRRQLTNHDNLASLHLLAPILVKPPTEPAFS